MAFVYTLRVAILGSGPSGFYAAESLLSQTSVPVQVDMFERLPTPFGLVRGGVAPDHQKIKTVSLIYEKTAQRTGFRFFGNVEFGKDVFLPELKKIYGALIFAVGAKSDRKMGIPGENLNGSVPATDFVGWYNGHPDYSHLKFDLSVERVAVVGNGNVAMDVTRILAVDPRHLEQTDIAGYALESLKKSRVKEILLLGRRGIAQAAFTNPEIRELCELPGSDLIVDPNEVQLDPLSQEFLSSGQASNAAKNNVQILQNHSKLQLKNQSKKIVVRFLVSPTEIFGQDGNVSAVQLEKNRLYKEKDGSLRPKGTGQYETLPVGLALRSVGYKGLPLQDVPYDEKSGTIPNLSGRVISPETKSPLTGLYAVGWAKRGPSGVIGTNKPDSHATVEKVLEDARTNLLSVSPPSNADDILSLLQNKKVRVLNYADWKKIDSLEIQNGKSKGKSREKFTTIPEMLDALSHC
ncbi:MAG: FAD-dependent oxidoreductase [Elusimicrobia bacterium]|nr:FAD-dependent oxidoreductase [Elusimicrobiota bacterium]